MKPWQSWLVVFASSLASGCLDPKGAYLSTMDTVPPRVVSSTPITLGGVTGTIPTDSEYRVTFSEAMEPRSLRGGIQLFQANAPIELEFGLPPSEPGNPEVDRGDVEYTVTYKAKVALEPATRHTLVYSTILTDTEGLPLETETRITFVTDP